MASSRFGSRGDEVMVAVAQVGTGHYHHMSQLFLSRATPLQMAQLFCESNISVSDIDSLSLYVFPLAAFFFLDLLTVAIR